VVNVAARGFDDVIDSLIVHVCGADTADVDITIGGNQAGAIERIGRDYFHIFDLD